MAAVTAYQTRVLQPTEYRAANELFVRCLHRTPDSDENWAKIAPSYEPGRVFGTLAGDEVVGTALSYPSELSVPGGRRVPAALVSRVGVRADHTRRGVLTELMRAQLSTLAEPVAVLHASEAMIYGRFGYGVAARERSYTVDSRRAALRPEVPAGGSVRMVTGDKLWEQVSATHERIDSRRPGQVRRPAYLWANSQVWVANHGTNTVGAVHTGPDGDDGYVIYAAGSEDDGGVLDIFDFHTASPLAWAGLWRYLLSVDLVSRIRAWDRPVDEAVEWLLVDRRTVRVDRMDDDLWLRLVDVPAALAARDYGGAESVVIEVRDALLPGNAGRYQIGPDKVIRTEAPAQLALDVDTLSALYLGDTRASMLAEVGRLDVLDPAALRVADQLFTTAVVPWVGTGF
jgi:predicted acetyltransferase